jgi:hypothetical protein
MMATQHLTLPQLLSAAAFTWTLQVFVRRWIVAKRVASSLAYVTFCLYISHVVLMLCTPIS